MIENAKSDVYDAFKRKCVLFFFLIQFPFILWSDFIHVASIYANLLEQKKWFALEKSLTLTGLVWDTNMAAVSLIWDTNMAALTSCENTL